MSADNNSVPMAPASGGQQPEKKKEKRERLKGFAGLLVGQLAALNHIPKFKERFGAVDLKFLLVATDMYPGALVHVDHGEVKISAVPKEECKKWKKTGAQGLLQCSTAQFMDIVMRKLDPVKGWITRKIKIRGPRKLIELSKMLAILSRASKPKAPPATPKV